MAITAAMPAIIAEVASLFRYATLDNRYKVIKIWQRSETEFVAKVYQRCVACNCERFNVIELLQIDLTNLAPRSGYFCTPCAWNETQLCGRYGVINSKKVAECLYNFKYSDAPVLRPDPSAPSELA